MNDEPVNIIRESTRNFLQIKRHIHRDKESDNRRQFNNSKTEDINNVVLKLKTKTSINVSELQILKNAILDNEKYIEFILNTHGALRGLVRELSGNEINKQCAAAGACCNLALGDARACSALVKAAGPYLIAALDNLSTELAVTCVWSIGNLASSGIKVCEVLAAQGALGKLIQLLSINNLEVQEAAFYAIIHFAYQLRDDFKIEHLNKTIEAISRLEITMTSSYLLFLLSCHKDFSTLNLVEIITKVLQYLPGYIQNHISYCRTTKQCCPLVYLLRCLANANVNVYEVIVNYFIEKNLSELFKKILGSNDEVAKSLMWLVGNLYNYNNESIFFNNLFNRM